MSRQTNVRKQRGGAVGRGPSRYVVRLTGCLERHEAEALQVEIKALAKQHGLVIRDITVRRGASEGSA